MPIDRYRGISLQRELVNKIEEYINSHPETGYKSLADFVTDAIRKRCEELKILGPAPPEPPELEHFNVNEDHVTIIDHKMRRIPDVFFRNNRVWCDVCEEEDCRHVRYALKIPKVVKILSENGWVIDEEEGKIIRKPY